MDASQLKQVIDLLSPGCTICVHSLGQGSEACYICVTTIDGVDTACVIADYCLDDKTRSIIPHEPQVQNARVKERDAAALTKALQQPSMPLEKWLEMRRLMSAFQNMEDLLNPKPKPKDKPEGFS